jgi:hypothetical protein
MLGTVRHSRSQHSFAGKFVLSGAIAGSLLLVIQAKRDIAPDEEERLHDVPAMALSFSVF